MATSEESTELLGKLATLKSEFYGQYEQQVIKNRRFYDLEYTEEVAIYDAPDLLAFIPTTAARAIDDPADHILTTPRIKIPRRATTDDQLEEQEIAETKRKFLAAWWSRVEERDNIVSDSIPILLNEGRVCWRRRLRRDLLPDAPAKGDRAGRKRYNRAMARLGREEFLWEMELLDNLTVFHEPFNHRDPEYVYYQCDILCEQAKRMFPQASGEWTKNGWNSKVKYTEYWTKPTVDEPGRYIRWIEDEIIADEDNPYSYIPIFIEDAGFGSNRSNALPHERFRGMTEKLFSTFIAEARQMTSWEGVAEITAFAPIITRNMSADRKINVGPGQTINLSGDPDTPGSEHIEALKWPEIPLGVVQLVQKTTQMANEFTKMDTISGMPVSGVETASEADQQIRNASAKLSKPIGGMRRLIQRTNRATFMDVELDIESPVTIYGAGIGSSGVVTLAPTQIAGFYENHAELVTSDQDAISQIKARFWGDMYRLIPFMSAMTAMERGDIADDPLAEMLQRAAEDLFLSPEMTMVRTLTGAQSLGQLKEMMEAAKEGPAAPAGPPMVGSDQMMLQQEDITAPLEQRTVDTGYQNRDILQRASQYRE